MNDRTHTIAVRSEVVTVTFRGLLTITNINATMAELHTYAGNPEQPHAVVLDVLGIDGFEPGVPARIIRWLGANVATVPCAILVTVSPVLIATVRAAALLLPSMSFLAVATRAEAQGGAERLVSGRLRTSTDVRGLGTAVLARKESA